jgi:hypothetical protein
MAMTARLLPCLVLLLAAVLTAQAPTAELTGTISDVSGAVVPNAEVTATNEETGFTRKVSSNELGFYTVPLLPPGIYRMSVQKEGFRSVERKGLRLHVSDKVTLDYALEVGALAETVSVSAETPLLQTEQASQGAVIDNSKIVTLPLNGRNPFSLAALAPGVQPGGGFFTARVFQEQVNQGNFIANGGASFQNDILMDGTSNTVAGHGQLAMTPSVDAIEEFRVQTSNYSAEYGRTGGAIINIVTKAGTNQLRGTAYEFLRNKVLDAGNYFNNAAGIERQPFVYNQYGITSGGPVYLPKIYDGRNRTFFFVSYEGVKVRRARFFNGTVPTEAMRTGNFNDLRSAAGQPILIYNPFSTRRQGSGYIRDIFPGNTIPASMHDKVGVNASQYIPLPNQQTPTVARNYIANASQANNLTMWQWRGDHNLSSNNRIFVRLSKDKQEDIAPNFYGNIAGEPNTYSYSAQPDWHATVSDTHNFGAATLLDVRAGFARNGFDRRPKSAGFDPTELGFPSALRQSAQELYFPTFNVGGYSGVGSRANDKFILGADTYSLVPQLTVIRGRHTMKIGGDFRAFRHNTFNASSPVGTYAFAAGFTQGPDPLRSSLTAGDGFASMLLGTMGSATAQVRASISYQTLYSAGYFQDDIKVNSKLTLNLGLRYDYEGPRTERFNRLSFFDYDAINPVGQSIGLPDLRGGLQFVGVDGNPRGWSDPDRNNFGPRFGFAYQPFAKTAIRGGYGLTYLPGGTSNSGYGAGQDGFSVATSEIATEDGGLTPFTLLSNAFSRGLDQPSGSSLGMRTLLGQGVAGYPRWVRTGYMQQWSFNIQRELPGQFHVEAGYVGSRGVKLPVSFQLNSLPDQYLSLRQSLLDQVPNPFASVVSSGALTRPTTTRGQLLRPYPQFTGVNFPQSAAGSSSYHSFQFSVQRRYSNGLSLTAAYTNAKLISDTDGLKSGSWIPGEVSVGAQNPNDLRMERAVAPQDVSQRLVFNYIYDLPFGKGKALLSGNRIASALAGGWTITGITTLQKGRPLNLTAPNNTNSYGGGSRPNNNGQSAALPSGDRTLRRWFNTSVFSQPEPFTFGTTGRTLPDVREPGITNFDFSVHRTFSLLESLRLQFRAEFFNALNTPQFGRPNGAFGNVLFGVINSQANSPREIQFGLKLIY